MGVSGSKTTKFLCRQFRFQDYKTFTGIFEVEYIRLKKDGWTENKAIFHNLFK